MKSRVPDKIKRAAKKCRSAGACAGEPDVGHARLVKRGMKPGELLGLFTSRALSSGAKVHIVSDGDSLKQVMSGLLKEGASVAAAPSGGRRMRIFGSRIVDFVPRMCRIIEQDQLKTEGAFGLDVAITGTELGIAETGSILIRAGEGRPRRISLTAETHIALVAQDSIVADLLDWHGPSTVRDAKAHEEARASSKPPEYGSGGMVGVSDSFTLITGPSKTADIELKLVIGVHGPAALHIIVF